MVNPTTPIGERDIKPTPTGRIVVDFLRRKFPAYVDTGLNLVDVVDCARGHLLAMEKAVPGERYILGGENLALKQILDKLATITGLPSPKVKLPYAMAYATGAQHLTRAQFQSLLHPTCPPVGYVRPNQRVLNAADVASPVTVKLVHPEYGEFQVDIAFTARQAVTTGSRWYEDYMTNPAGCSSSGQGGQIEFGNIRAGELIHERRLIGTCKGTYYGLIGYMQNSGPIDQESAGGATPGRDGSMIVGRFSFTIR